MALSLYIEDMGCLFSSDADPQDPHFLESKDPDPQKNSDPGSGSWGINLRKNLIIFIAFIADILLMGEMDYRFHAAHLDRGLTIHEAVPGGFNRAGEGL